MKQGEIIKKEERRDICIDYLDFGWKFGLGFSSAILTVFSIVFGISLAVVEIINVLSSVFN